MLLPYYITSMNIEQEFYTATHRYLPYEGICLVDTFEMIEEPADAASHACEHGAR